METPLKLAILAIIIASFSAVSTTAATTIEEAAALSSSSTTTLLPPPPAESLPHSTADPLSATHFFAPVLTHLGFHELAMAVPSLSSSSSTTIWSEPFTVFAPSDASIHTCSSCTVHNLLQEHIVPGVFSFHYLRSLAFGTKIETIVPGRCITVTSTVNGTKIFVGGVEITRPDLFNNGLFVVHGLDGYVAHLSPISCNIERMTSLSFPPQVSDRSQSLSQYAVMRLMLSDAMLRLRITGFSILALAFKVKYAELVGLQNMTVFALDDVTIFSGGHAYVSNVRFHIVPNRLLTISDLEKLPTGTVLPTLDEGQNLVVTSAGGGLTPMRINYVRIKSANLMLNLKIVVHGLYLPFPHIHSTMMGLGGIGRSGLDAAAGTDHANSGFSDVALSPEIKTRAAIAIEDHHAIPNASRDTNCIVVDLKRKYTSWRNVEGSHWHTRFNHLINYGAGYYSYLHAKCFAATIWQKVCQEDPLSLATGTALRTKFLQHGGAKDPASLLNDLAGDEILKYHNGGIVPDFTSLCDEMKIVHGKQ